MPYHISKRSAQQIVETVKDVCGKDVNYINPDGMIYASTDTERIGQFHQIGKQVADCGDTIEVNDDDTFYGTHPGVNIPITYRGNIISVIGISGSPDEVRKYAYLAQKITTLLLREQELDRRENDDRTRMNYIIRSLIDKKRTLDVRVVYYLEDMKINVHSPYQLIIVKLDSRYHPNNLGMIEGKIENAFRNLDTFLYTFQYPNEYIAIVKQKILESRSKILESLNTECSHMLKIAISSAHPIHEQSYAYTEAQLALKSSRDGSSISHYDRLGIEILCSSAEEEVKNAYREKYLGKLNERDIDLLKVYYQENMSLAKTSERLFLHKNTIQYQLDKIYRLTGYNPRNFVDATGFYSALLM